MPSYRFCRTDDVTALAEAYDLCAVPHLPGDPGMSIERFRALVRELDVWTSSCMLATHEGAPIGVLIATKRPREALIWCVAIRPGFERQGHGRHLVTSLSQKLAILGPPRILVEVPEDQPGTCAFFEACGFSLDAVFTDYVVREPPAPPPSRSAALVIPVTVDDLVANGVLGPEAVRPWSRTYPTLLARRERITGEAVSSADRIEAWVLYGDDTHGTETSRGILAFGAADPVRGPVWLDVLLRRAARAARTLHFERSTPEEQSLVDLEGLGFSPGAKTVRFAAVPQSA